MPKSKAKAEAAPPPDEIVARAGRPRLIVGIGASAGGLGAFKTFFAGMRADTGMAFVLIQHLDPNHESALVAIVASYTSIPVRLAEDGTAVAADHVYVIPPDAILTIEGGTLRVTRPAPAAARRTSINTFLTSLAHDQGENAVGIILSGFGSDGALGIAAIKEQGGLTLSQAEFDHHAKSGMPQSAASAGFVDHVLSVEAMPDALVNHQHHRTIFDATKGPDGIRTDLPNHLATICAVLHSRIGRDFSQYKTGTLLRRIQRRMHVLQTDSVPAYIDLLRASPTEADLLFRELLISVTRFFRDRDAFAALESKIIPGIVADTKSPDPIRVWVAGCATGEEAYTVAILLKEGLARAGGHRPVQIFATDVDDRAIEGARAGLYADTIAADLSPERLERNFVKEGSTYRIVKDIRDMCLFSTHDLVRDPPFSRLDLVTCRNLLIYFEPPLQQLVLGTFHYALRPGRHLFLGASESVTVQSRLFTALDKRHRLYSRRDTAASFPTVSAARAPAGALLAKRVAPPVAEDIDQLASRAIARYAPAFLVVDRQHEILRFSGQTAKYIEPAGGVASLHLFNMLHAELRGAVRAALRQAAASGQRVLQEGLRLRGHLAGNAAAEEPVLVVNLIVEPLPGGSEAGLFMIGFQDVPRLPQPVREAPAADAPDDAALRALHQELQVARERLRSLTEELEAATEELQSSNEEYLSVNEELQSANEELETSKEELQSLNEELQTINAELSHRNESLLRSNSDLANLFDSTSIATLFLDRDLRIRRFTPRLLEIFNVREGDEGRPITDIVSHLTRDGLWSDVRDVLASLTPIEREVAVATGGTSYLMQVRPYRDQNNAVDGAVITFVDISERKRHERARSRLAAIVESSQDAIISHDLDGLVTSWNEGAELLYGFTAAEAVGQSMPRLLEGALPEIWPQLLARLEQGERIAHFDSARTAKDGRAIEVSLTISPVREGDGRIVGASVVARDVSERRAAEQKTALLLGELDHRVKNILAIVAAVVSQTLKTGLPPEMFAAEIDGRIKAIAMAHSLLTSSGQGEVSLRAIVATELAPYDQGKGRLGITGGEVELTPKAALALAMAVHELASNAAKYGALSTLEGALAVTWAVAGPADRPVLRLTWVETGGPAVRSPTRRGFGTTLIERTLTHELDAEVKREFLPAGLRCTMTIPLTAEVGRLRQAGDPAGGGVKRDAEPGPDRPPHPGGRG